MRIRFGGVLFRYARACAAWNMHVYVENQHIGESVRTPPEIFAAPKKPLEGFRGCKNIRTMTETRLSFTILSNKTRGKKLKIGC
jgi:hypothetical protein